MAKENLCEEYRKLTLECKELRNKIKAKASIKSVLKNYDTFDADLIGGALAELITVISGSKFIYNSYYQRDTDYKIIHIVVDLEKRKGHATFKRLVKNGYAISMKVGNSYNSLKVYPCPAYNSLNFDVEKFGYVTDFIKSLIQYCYERDIKKATKEDINACLTEFLKEYKKEHVAKGPILKKVKGEN